MDSSQRPPSIRNEDISILCRLALFGQIRPPRNYAEACCARLAWLWRGPGRGQSLAVARLSRRVMVLAGAATRRPCGRLSVAWLKCRPRAARSAGLLRGLTRRSHRAPAIERHLPEQAIGSRRRARPSSREASRSMVSDALPVKPPHRQLSYPAAATRSRSATCDHCEWIAQGSAIRRYAQGCS
jgi:hypothetical protein